MLLVGIPWGLFDGASQGHPPRCGVGVVSYISGENYFKVIYAPGSGSNMKAEFSTVWTLLFMLKFLKLRKVQVMGDSKVEIDWENERIQLEGVSL
jgi:ribonuclease HI